jgi:CDP-glycerol glycerophosphotransferase (TagB/SpsB family)
MIPVGNFRAAYWEKQHSFYQRLLREAIISQLPKKQPCLLYAPTWEDADGSGSFWQAFPTLASHLPDSLNLLVQLHPNTRKRFAIELEGLMGRYEQKKNILFLEPFPPIYPLLSLCTAYIGDLSSIGYDFLKMDKPLFFLNPNQRTGLPLFACGMEVSPETIFKQIEKVDLFSPIRKKTYADTFAPLPDFQTLKAALIR